MCHICLSEVPPKHSSALFSPEGLKGDLPGCLSQLLLVPFAEGNCLPPFVCQNCQAKAESIESKLYKLCELAKYSFGKFHVQGGKRPKEATGVGASPCTLQVQPAVKRLRG